MACGSPGEGHLIWSFWKVSRGRGEEGHCRLRVAEQRSWPGGAAGVQSVRWAMLGDLGGQLPLAETLALGDRQPLRG